MLENFKTLAFKKKASLDQHWFLAHLIFLVSLMPVDKYLNVLKHFQNVAIWKM